MVSQKLCLNISDCLHPVMSLKVTTISQQQSVRKAVSTDTTLMTKPPKKYAVYEHRLIMHMSQLQAHM
jgi:hypothetical protein